MKIKIFLILIVNLCPHAAEVCSFADRVWLATELPAGAARGRAAALAARAGADSCQAEDFAGFTAADIEELGVPPDVAGAGGGRGGGDRGGRRGGRARRARRRTSP
jgi:hypothetical protein